MSKKFYAVIVVLFLMFSNQVFAQPNQPVADIVGPIITQFMQAKQVPGVAVAIYYQGQDHFYDFGVANKQTGAPVTPNTIFAIGSVTKVFTSSLLAICIEQGRCKLSDPVVQYIPALRATHNLPIDQITLQELATHTSSLPRDPDDFGVYNLSVQQGYNQLMQAFIQWRPSYPIGTQFKYSNLGFGMLGQAMGYAYKTTYINALANEVLGPLELHNTFLAIPANFNSFFAQSYNVKGAPIYIRQGNNFPGGGALLSTSEDLLQFLKANLGVVPGVMPPLSAALQFAHKGIFTVNPHMIQGLGWQRNTKDNLLIINKNGLIAGFSSYVAFLPQQQIAIVVLTNKREPNPGKPAVQILTELTS